MTNNIPTNNILPFCVSRFKEKVSIFASEHNKTHKNKIYIIPTRSDKPIYGKMVFTRNMTESGIQNITDTDVLDMLINIYSDEIVNYISQVSSVNANIEFTFLSMRLGQKRDFFCDNVYMTIVYSINKID